MEILLIRNTQCNSFGGVILIFLCAIVLQPNNPTECIDNSKFCIDSPTSSWCYSTVGLSIRWSRTVYHRSQFWQDYRYTSQNQCIVSPALCRTIDTVVKTSISEVLRFVGLLIHLPRRVYRKSYLIQDYQYTIRDQCIVIHTVCLTIDILFKGIVLLVLHFVLLLIYQSRPVSKFFILKTFHVLYHHMEAHSWCLVQRREIYLIQKCSRLAAKKFDKITKKLDFCLFFTLNSNFHY